MKLAWYHLTIAWDFWSEDIPADFRAAEVRRVALWLNALVLMQRREFDRAVTGAEAAVAMAPYDARVLRYLTEVLLASGRYATALEWLATAQPREPGREKRYHEARGSLYRHMGRYEDAIREYDAAEPLSSYHTFSRAIIDIRLGRLDAARARVAAGLREVPDMTQERWRSALLTNDLPTGLHSPCKRKKDARARRASSR